MKTSVPLSGTVELAARIEAAEVDLLDACLRAVAAGGSQGTLRRRLAGGLAAWTGDASPLNKIAGLGFGGVPDGKELTAIEEQFAIRKSGVQVELASLADTEVVTSFGERGYRFMGCENVLARNLDLESSEPSRAPHLQIRPSEPDELDLWLDVLVEGFANPDERGVVPSESFPREALERTMRDMAGAVGFRRSLAWLDDTPVGGSALRISPGGVAHLCGAATLPEYRRRGVQGALLEARLDEARRAGCTLAVVTTQPGSTSQQNVERRGFQLLYVRSILGK